MKATNAEDAGAVAVLVYNDQRPAVESMEGVEELLLPRIPTIFITADQGEALLHKLGSQVQVHKVSNEQTQLTQPINTNVVFRCSEDFQRPRMCLGTRSRASSSWSVPVRCQVGDTVDVKLWVKSNMASSYPSDVSAATEKELHELAVMQAANRHVFSSLSVPVCMRCGEFLAFGCLNQGESGQHILANASSTGWGLSGSCALQEDCLHRYWRPERTIRSLCSGWVNRSRSRS